MAVVTADPKIDLKRVKQIISTKKAEFENELEEKLQEKYRKGNSYKNNRKNSVMYSTDP